MTVFGFHMTRVSKGWMIDVIYCACASPERRGTVSTWLPASRNAITKYPSDGQILCLIQRQRSCCFLFFFLYCSAVSWWSDRSDDVPRCPLGMDVIWVLLNELYFEAWPWSTQLTCGYPYVARTYNCSTSSWHLVQYKVGRRGAGRGVQHIRIDSTLHTINKFKLKISWSPFKFQMFALAQCEI